MCEALWSDPQASNGRAPSKRGIGVAFGPDVTRDFLTTNNLDLVVRSHEVCCVPAEVHLPDRCRVADGCTEALVSDASPTACSPKPRIQALLMFAMGQCVLLG